jgi:hypothetical protein
MRRSISCRASTALEAFSSGATCQRVKGSLPRTWAGRYQMLCTLHQGLHPKAPSRRSAGTACQARGAPKPVHVHQKDDRVQLMLCSTCKMVYAVTTF